MKRPGDVPSKIGMVPVTIASGESLSAMVELGGMSVVGVIMPDAWTAANLTFQTGISEATLNNLYEDTGSEAVVVAAASRLIRVDPAMFLGFDKIKVRSGPAAAAVNQGAARALTLILRDI